MDDIVGLFFAVVIFPLLVASIIGSICYVVVEVVTPKTAKSRRLAFRTAFLITLASILYLEAGLIVHDFVRESRGSDAYFDSTYHYPLVNGYEFEFSGEYPDGGFIRGPIGFGEDAKAVQVAGKWIFADQGEIPSNHEQRSNGSFIYHGPDNNPTVELGHEGDALADKFKREREQDPPKQYLIVDTTTSEVTHVYFEDLKMAATEQGVALKLVTTEEALNAAVSAAAPGRGFLIVLFLPVLLALIFLLYRLRQLIRTV